MMTAGRDPTNVVFRRLLAWVVDGALDVAVLWAGIALFGVELERQGTTGTLYDVAGTEDTSGIGLVLLLYFAWTAAKVCTVAFLGWTPGKFICAVRVVGWNGHPPGFLRALARAVVVTVLTGIFGCFYWALGLATILLTKEHRQPADWLAGTWVVDSIFLGRLIVHGPRSALVGPPAVTREQAAAYAAEKGLDLGAGAPGAAPPPLVKSTKPFMDKTRGTYVVWNEKRNAWLQFDKETNQWGPLR